MSSIIGLLFGDITPLVVGLRATEYMAVACATVWTYEYFLTLDREVALVWSSRWSFGKVMFFLNRYSPIIDTVLVNFLFLGVRNQGNCPELAPAVPWLITTGMLWSEIILNMKAWAIWGGTRYMLIFLVTFTTAIFISACILLQKLLNSVTYIPIPDFLVSVLGLTCAPLPRHGEIWSEYVVFMIGQAVIATLALTRAFQQYRLTNSPLLGTMFHDGLLYYVYTLTLSIANVVFALVAPIQWGVFLELPQRTLSSIFCTRVLLNLRGSYFRSSNSNNSFNDGGTKSTGFNFQRPRRLAGHSESSHSRSTSDRLADGFRTTLGTHDTVHYDETDFTLGNIDEEQLEAEEGLPPTSQGWTWTDPQQPPQLTLRPMTPFNVEIEMAELSRPTPPPP